MNEEQPLIQEGPDEAHHPIGARLREAREALELSREEVALELHLSAAQITHLEDEDFARFPAAIFVSGYLRKYARLLGIPGEPLVEAFERSGAGPPSLHADLTSGMPRPRKINVEYWAGVLVGVGVIILLLVWLLTGEETETTAPQAPAQEALPLRPQAEPPPAVVAAPRAVLPEPAASQPAAASEVEAEEPAVPAPAASDRLVLHFTADSWVEITDGKGRRLMFDLGKAGQTRVLDGSAPFSILLGYAPGVEIEYNGKPYDHQQHIRNNVARFKLGGA
ncbi:MAG: RodZ domain-containing protein [Gammaproteobacteria bacterium]